MSPGPDRATAKQFGVALDDLRLFAVGCPVCNKLVVALLGFSGALTYFGPVQPILGVVSVVLAAWTVRVRLRSLTGSCPVANRDGLAPT